MDFINFLLNVEAQFWISVILFIAGLYIYTVIKEAVTDIIDVRCTYGRYCTNLKVLYKPTKRYFIDGIKKEFPWIIVFVAIYTLYSYYQYTV